jgi:hypothetical protein
MVPYLRRREDLKDLISRNEVLIQVGSFLMYWKTKHRTKFLYCGRLEYKINSVQEKSCLMGCCVMVSHAPSPPGLEKLLDGWALLTVESIQDTFKMFSKQFMPLSRL